MSYHRKKTWKDCSDEKILAVFEEVKNEAKRIYPEYFETKVEFYIDSSRRFLGHCTGEIESSTLYNEFGLKNHFQFLRWKNVAIVLSKYVTDLDNIRKTLVHEFGHLVTPKEKHSYFWETRANKIGERWGIKCKRLAAPEETLLFTENIQKLSNLKDYKVICTGCGKLVHRTKMCDIIKHPENWKCGVCGSRFKNV